MYKLQLRADEIREGTKVYFGEEINEYILTRKGILIYGKDISEEILFKGTILVANNRPTNIYQAIGPDEMLTLKFETLGDLHTYIQNKLLYDYEEDDHGL